MKLVITGEIETGKSTLAHIMKCQFPNEVQICPDPLDLLKKAYLPSAQNFKSLRSQQKALYFMHRELENWVEAASASQLIICDHGTLDCLLNWPDSSHSFFAEIGTSLQKELDRYDWVIQICHQNLDPSLFSSPRGLNPQDFWSFHPKRFLVSPEPDFSTCLGKITQIVSMILKEESYESILTTLHHAAEWSESIHGNSQVEI